MPTSAGHRNCSIRLPSVDLRHAKSGPTPVKKSIVNPTGIIPLGPDASGWLTPHGREELGGRPFGDGTPPGPPPAEVPRVGFPPDDRSLAERFADAHVAMRGRVATREEALASFAAGRSLLAEQRLDVHELVAQGAAIGVRATWHGVLATAFPGLPAGAALQAEVAQFLTVRDGLLVRQETFDCYAPLPAV